MVIVAMVDDQTVSVMLYAVITDDMQQALHWWLQLFKLKLCTYLGIHTYYICKVISRCSAYIYIVLRVVGVPAKSNPSACTSIICMHTLIGRFKSKLLHSTVGHEFETLRGT